MVKKNMYPKVGKDYDIFGIDKKTGKSVFLGRSIGINAKKAVLRFKRKRATGKYKSLTGTLVK